MKRTDVQLRLVWRIETGKRVPSTLPRYLVIRMHAYRVQANRLGDLDPFAMKQLTRKGARADTVRSKNRLGSARVDSHRSLKPGSVLVSDWKDELQSVTVTSNGFQWQGKEYLRSPNARWLEQEVVDPHPVF